MLEDTIRYFFTGYRISSKLMKVARYDPDLTTYEGRLAQQRNQPIKEGNANGWERIGYISGVVVQSLIHPYKTYKIFR